jgi:tRNA modification GTPase
MTSTAVIDRDTIVASATPPGRGGIGVVRISGPRVPDIARELLGSLPEPRSARLAGFRDGGGGIIDFGLALYFPAPQSFTGEAVLELQGHGGPVIQELLIERVLALSARRARPGEFSERAFLNDKLDLTQAEAIADLIDAGSNAAARAALRSLQGEFSTLVHAVTHVLTELRVYVEAAIDFPEEEIDFLSTPELAARGALVKQRFDAVERSARQGRLLSEGMLLVIAGRPNAGKSTLLNRLAGVDAAIVTPLPGTTRDLLRERIQLDGLPVQLVDTAGLRAPDATADVVEQEGMRRARAELLRADRLLFVIDGAADPLGVAYDEERASLPAGLPVTLVFNKRDIADHAAHLMTPRLTAPLNAADAAGSPPRLWIAASTGEGVDALREHLKSAMGYVDDGAGAVSARARHLDALLRARAAFDRAVQLLTRRQGELVAEELRQAALALGEITGEISSDDLLGEIFGNFCIGK